MNAPKRRPQRIAPRAEPEAAAYLARPSDGAMIHLDPLRTHFLDHARGVDSALIARALGDDRTLAQRRGYAPEDLEAVAEIGYHYLINGGVRFARMLFEGLAAIAPNEPYYALALGLASDHAGDKEAARREYGRAAALDPTDGRPEVNLAELCIEADDPRGAKAHLHTALKKLAFKNDPALARKARALLGRADALAARGARR
jgi:Flp pilus assembly protein TadD